VAQQTRPQLSWLASAARAGLLLAAILLFAIAVNAAAGRVIHPDIVAALAGPAILALTLAFRLGL
jgi:hypothetical protein